MSKRRSYGSPAAFRTALTERLRAKAETGPWTLPQLQRQIAYDRLLERLYLVDNAWIVKGATALLARDIGVRGSLDVDVYREAAREVAEAELRQAAGRDIGTGSDSRSARPSLWRMESPAYGCRSRRTSGPRCGSNSTLTS
jgi:hypothetical protein